MQVQEGRAEQVQRTHIQRGGGPAGRRVSERARGRAGKPSAHEEMTFREQRRERKEKLRDEEKENTEG